MFFCRPRFSGLVFLGSILFVWPGPLLLIAAEPLRSEAVVNLTFDEPTGPALDIATAGTVKDNGSPINGPSRIRSPFWNQSSRQALALEADSRQAIRIPDSPDLDHLNGVTISLLYVNLHPKTDPAFHHVFAKREIQDGVPRSTNYALSYSMQADLTLLQVNDGGAPKLGVFPSLEPIGYRQPVFLTAVYQVGDAPAPQDEDTENDDILIRFYVNGKIVKPKAATGGFLVENDVWLTDVRPQGLLNDGPLFLGGNLALLEFNYGYTGALLDEFSLFPRVLTGEEIAALFVEVAGANVAPLPADEGPALPAPAPEIAALSMRGLQTGHTAVLAVTGKYLDSEPRLLLPFCESQPVLRTGATAEQAEFDVSVPANVPAGHYPVRVQTAHGVSPTLTIAVDSLPQVPYAASSIDQPVELPVAISGTLSGSEAARVHFRGARGQRLVIDLECRRFGSPLDPVLELRGPKGTPLAIAWSRPQYQGDTRIELTLPDDGVYNVELHDLAYKAPGPGSYRLKIGDLKIVDATFPPAVAAGATQKVAAIGPGMNLETALPVDMPTVVPGVLQTVALPVALGTVGPAPVVALSEAIEVLEAAQPEGQVQPVDVRFTDQARLPVAVNGRLMRPGENDMYLLLVKPGAKLSLTVDSHNLRSPLDPQMLLVSPSGSVLAISEEKPVIEFRVPDDMSEVQLVLRDLNGRGGSDFIYRLRIAQAGQPDFSLAFERGAVALPRNGTTALRIEATRAGYHGPILLSLVGADDLSIAPTEIPPGVSKALLVISSRNDSTGSATVVRQVRLLAQSLGLEPPLHRAALAPVDQRLALLPTERAELTVTLTPAIGATLSIGAVPPVLFRGTDAQLPFSLKVTDEKLVGLATRYTLITTETPRTKRDPADFFGQRKLPMPLVHSIPEQFLPPGEFSGSLRVVAPAEVSEPWLDAIVRADFVAHPYSEKILASVFSLPIRINVHDAVSVQLAANALALASKSQTRITGTMTRTPGFTDVVDVQLVNLPPGYLAPRVTVAPDQESFELVVTAPEISAAADIANVAFRATGPSGASLVADIPLQAKASP
ncbi:MAG: hypothetical protein ACT4QC_16690 [Planctomycetaceae bacterium]